MTARQQIRIQIWTERFLGTKERCESFLNQIETMDRGRLQPQLWSDCEPVRLVYSGDSRALIESKWTEEAGGRISHEMFFRRKRPNAEVWVSSWRGKVPYLNRISLALEASVFTVADGTQRLKSIVLGMAQWSEAVYATAWHTRQKHLPQAQFTPLKRLERIDWLTYLGKPYLELFGGEERVLSAPVFSAERVAGSVLLLAADRPDSPIMMESNSALLAIEQFLGVEAFAGENYPDVPCRVPNFDLAETVVDGNSTRGIHRDPMSHDALVVEDTNTGQLSTVAVAKPT